MPVTPGALASTSTSASVIQRAGKAISSPLFGQPHDRGMTTPHLRPRALSPRLGRLVDPPGNVLDARRRLPSCQELRGKEFLTAAAKSQLGPRGGLRRGAIDPLVERRSLPRTPLGRGSDGRW